MNGRLFVGSRHDVCRMGMTAWENPVNKPREYTGNHIGSNVRHSTEQMVLCLESTIGW